MDRVVETRKSPRISVNKLGEYMTATPARRRRIVRDAKFPSTFMVARYTSAESAIADWICTGCTDDVLLAQAMARLSAADPGSQFAKGRRDSCLEALLLAGNLRDTIDLPTGPEVSIVRNTAAIPLPFGEVTISVRPEVLIYTGPTEESPDAHKADTGERRLGGIKLYFSKVHPLTDQSADYIATLLWRSLLVRSAQELLFLDHSQIKVVDVFAGKVFTLPKRHKQRMKEIEAACGEIGERWSAVER